MFFFQKILTLSPKEKVLEVDGQHYPKTCFDTLFDIAIQRASSLGLGIHNTVADLEI